MGPQSRPVAVPDLSDLRGAQGRGLDALTELPELRARDVIRETLRTYRDRFARVAGTAAIVFGATAWVTALVETTIHDRGLGGSAVDVVLQVAASFIGAFGFVFYAGLLDLMLDDYRSGRPDRPFLEVVRALPLWRLFAADLLLTITVAVLLLLLVIPGLIAFTLLSLVGPLIVTEQLHVLAAFRRSARLVRTRFWLVVLLVTVPVMIEEEVLHAVDYHSFPHPLIAAFLIAGVLGAAVASTIGLLETVLAFELRQRTPLDPHDAPGPASGLAPDAPGASADTVRGRP